MAFTTQPFPPITPEVAETIKILRNVPIFGDIDQSELARIVHVGVRKKYKKGSIILLEEEAGAALFIIASGKIKIVRTDDEGREVILSILGENDFFGEMAILDGLARSATAVAITKTDLFMIHRQDFLKLLHEYPAVAISLLRELTSRLRKADAQIKNLSLKDANGRVANVIIQIADDVGKIRKGRVEIDDLPLQQDLANMAGTSRETISRMLHQFIKKGHVELQGNKLIINDYEKFKSLYL
ncbi:MAG: Crp/Fnr family transcriptional regulator [Ignavibacteriae bacterium]|nr:Crp/Fnr family transcriptional regulator [Ignavibacteriota bacterium]